MENSLPTIYDDIKREWEALFVGTNLDPDEREDMGEFVSELELSSRKQTQVKLQPWLGIFEFGIEYLSYIHVALSETLPGRNKAIEARHKAAYVLTGSAVSFGLSARLLCISGFDTPARALLRTLVEAIFLCLAVLDDDALAQSFVKAQEDQDIKNFWHMQASPKKLHERIIDLEKNIGLEATMIEKLVTWRREEYEILSQSAHLSYLAAFITTNTPDLEQSDILKIGIFGQASSASHRTIFYAATTIWYFSRMSHNYLIGKDDTSKSLLILGRPDEWQCKMVYARDVLQKLVQANWDDR